MSNKSKASSFLSGLVDEPELKKMKKVKKSKVKGKGKEFLVYMVGDKPDTCWSYNHNPADGICYGRLEGYWDEDKENNVSRHYVRNESTNLKLMNYEKFMTQVIPNRDQIKIYPTEEDMLLDFL